jgi:hypothetical protein
MRPPMTGMSPTTMGGSGWPARPTIASRPIVVDRFGPVTRAGPVTRTRRAVRRHPATRTDRTARTRRGTRIGRTSRRTRPVTRTGSMARARSAVRTGRGARSPEAAGTGWRARPVRAGPRDDAAPHDPISHRPSRFRSSSLAAQRIPPSQPPDWSGLHRAGRGHRSQRWEHRTDRGSPRRTRDRPAGPRGGRAVEARPERWGQPQTRGYGTTRHSVRVRTPKGYRASP